MRRWVYIALALMLAAIGIATWDALRTQEPSYQGRRLTSWLMWRAQYRFPAGPMDLEGGTPRENAIRQIGADGLPTLLALAFTPHDSAPKKGVLGLGLLPWQMQRRFLMHNDEYVRRELARYALHVLGPIAKPAVPVLIGRLDEQHPGTYILAAQALASIGPDARDATPALVKGLSHAHSDVRGYSAMALGSIHAQPETVVPLLIQQLKALPPEWSFDCYAYLLALADYGPQARAAIPVIQGLLTNPSPNLRVAATNALKAIVSAPASAAASSNAPGLLE